MSRWNGLRVGQTGTGVGSCAVFLTMVFAASTGRWMQFTAEVWLMVQAGMGAKEIAWATMCFNAPLLLLMYPGGWLTDRFPRRRILIATQLLNAVLSGGMIAIVGTSWIGLGVICANGAFRGVIAAVDTPARLAFVTDLVPADRRHSMIGLLQSALHAAMVVGPALAGLTIAASGARSCMAACMVANCAAGVATAMISVRHVHRDRRDRRRSTARWEVIAHVAKHADRLVPLIGIAALTAGAYCVPLILSLLVARVWHGGPGSYGVLSACVAGGSIVGAIVALRWKASTRLEIGLLAGLVGVADLALAITHDIRMAALGLVAYGFFALMCTTSATALLTNRASPDLLGRVTALFMLAASPWAAPLHGVFTDSLGPEWMLAIGGASAYVLGLGIVITTGSAQMSRTGRKENMECRRSTTRS